MSYQRTLTPCRFSIPEEFAVLHGSEKLFYRPDFFALVDDGNDDPLQLVVEIKGYRRDDAKEKT